MPRNPKLFIPNKPYFITSRTECGLPFIPTEFMNRILEGILACAASRYMVDVCHYYWAANHFHMIVIPRSTEDVPLFMKYIKQESAHAINRLLGRKKRTVWCSSYDSPALLTPETVAKYIAYLYTNPERDKIIKSVNDYTGVCSWKSYKKGASTVVAKKIPRDCIPTVLDPTNLSKEDRSELCKYLKEVEGELNSFELKPYDCIRCFEGMENVENSVINKMIKLKINAYRRVYRNNRAIEKKESKQKGSLFKHSKKTLKMTQICLDYEPKKFGKKMIALSIDSIIRARYINWFKGIRNKAREVYKSWKKFKLDEEWPLHMFPPKKPRHKSPVEFFAFS